jgi:hypothetical protein
MKAFSIFFMLGVVVLFGCNSSDNKAINSDLIQNPLSADKNGDTSLLPKFKWKEQVHDFGVVIQGESVSYSFLFKNTGKSNLIISSVHASCGCTVPKYDTKPIAPGGEGHVEVVFDSSGRSGLQNKTVTVLANTQPSTVELHFSAEVVVPENR